MRTRFAVGLLGVSALASAGCKPTASTPSSESTSARVTWASPLEIARGGGERGPWQQHRSRYDYVDDPTVARAPGGGVAAAWVDHRTRDVHFQIYEPDGRPRFERPANVSRTPHLFSWLPRLELAGDDVFVLWQEIIFSGGSHGGEILFARSRDGGRTFEPVVNLSRSVPGDGKGRLDATTWSNGSLDLARDDASGALFAAWTEYDGPLWLARLADAGATWSAPIQIAGSPAHPARAPSLAAAPTRLYLAWTTGESATADIQLATSADGGRTFGAPTVVARTPGYSDAPKLAVDNAGTVHVVFADGARIVYTHARAAGHMFAAPRVVSADRPDGEVASYPSLALDDRGGIHVAWDLQRDRSALARGMAIAHSFDGGATFTAPAPVPGSRDPDGGWNGSHQGRLMERLVVDDGGIVLGVSSLRHGHSSRVWLVRGRVRAAP